MRLILAIFCTLLFTAFAFPQAPIIADHTVAKLNVLQSIPEAYLTAAKANLRIAYEHASHGSQITEGMTGLNAWKGSTYAFAKGGGSGILDYRDHDIEGWADLGNLWEPDNVDFEAWEPITRQYLAENPDINVIMWSWCTELSYDAFPADVNTYLSLMSGLEEDFPNVRFIYMTGHVDGRPPNTNLYIHNAMIRNYCIANNKILYDFGDIESYDPDGNFYADKRVTDCCNYDYDGSGETETDGGDPGIPTGGDRNWALDWQSSHTKNVDWFDCEASHTYPLNANMKAYAAWWLWARLAGWDGESNSIPVTGITVTGAGGNTTIITDNGTLQLSATVAPANATNKTVTWSITNGTGQATISSTGLVTAVANGTVTARATANDGSGVSGTLTITISNQVIPVSGITVTGTGGASTITTDNGTLQLSAAVSPANATNKTVAWSITNGTGQATISSTGLVTAIANGTVTARATANDGSGVSGTLTITISNQVTLVTGITVTGAGGATTINTDNGTLQLSAAVSPSDATNKTVTWSITNGTGQATISSAGLLTAVANGTVTARATANDGSGVSGTLTITISNQVIPVTVITVTGAGGATTINTDNGTLQLSAAVSPSDASNKTVTWSVTNGTGQAAISSAGLLTAVANGTVSAKATANDGSGVSGTLTITISNQVTLVTGITVTGAGGATTINTDNGTLQLSAVVSPSDATNKTVTWSVTNGTGQATISSTGLVTAVANGTVTAKATANDGSGVSGTLNITIDIPGCVNETFTTATGTLTDNSGSSNYGNNMSCTKLIQPSVGGPIVLQFTAFVTESGYDFVRVYDGATTSAALLGTFSGSALPPVLTSTGSSLLITFTTDNSNTAAGWSAHYSSNQAIPVTGITVTGAGGATTITTDKGTLQLSAAVVPPNATNKTVTWSVTNGTGQATINAAGLLTAVANGTVTARATANDGTGVYGMLTITISNQVIPVSGITVTGAGGATTITSGTLQLTAAVSPANATDKTVAWSVTNGTGQATISATGLVTATANGTVTAKATANDGSGVSGTMVITIAISVCNNEIFTDATGTITDNSGASDYGNNMSCTKLIQPTGGGSIVLQFTAFVTESGYDFVRVYDGATTSAALLGTFSGSALPPVLTSTGSSLLITFTTDNSVTAAGWSAHYSSNQAIPVTGITVTGAGGATTITTDKGTLQLSAAVVPPNATNKTVTWSVTNSTGQATINAAGLLTAVANGTVTARATANDGTGVYGTLTVTISNQVIPVTGITVTGASIITTDNGTLQLNAAVSPSDATNKTVTWSVTNGTGQATISSAGLVTAVANGTVSARATANDGTGVYGTLAITISNQVIPVTGITVTGAGGASIITTDNGTLQLNADVSPSSATDKTVTWSVTNGTGQATINSTGLLTAIADGTVIAKATANDGTGIFGTLEITIASQMIPVSSITISGAGGANTITTDGGTLQLNAVILPGNASEKGITWSVINGTGKAVINATGLITAISNGTVTARATANDGSGITGTLNLTITNQVIPVTSVTVTGEGGAQIISTNRGTLQLSATVLPADATDRTVTWSVTQGTGQAIINDSGLLTALADGTVTAKATANDGSGITGLLEVTISNQVIPVSEIHITSEEGITTINKEAGTLQLYVSVLPKNATDTSITWSIVKITGQASISSYGLVTAVADGVVMALATANDGSGVKDTLEILVAEQAVLIEIINVLPSEKEIPIIKEKSGNLQMEAEIIPSEASIEIIDWTVENLSGKAIIDNKGLVTAVANGSVKVIAKAKDGSNKSGYCMVAITNQDENTGIRDNDNASFQVFQSMDKLNIHQVDKNLVIDYCSLYSIHGILLNREKVNDDSIEMDISAYPPGIYIISLSNDQMAFPVKVAIH